ncbi:MAG: universal stress protein [Desulfobacteraceae bacterium]|nr:universal stress protein [Desulfobacteraceae bacterium]
MIPEIKKILYTTDLSENARYAFGYAAALANRFGAGITIFHVLEDTSSFRDSMVINIIGEEKWKDLVRTNEAKLLETIKQRLEKFCEDVSAELPSCPFITDDIIVKTGNPVEKILIQAKESNCDLVVMGTHGHGTLTDAVIGSTSRRVLRRCKKPVLVIRLPERNED